jgi:hypothetical protein
MRARRRQICQMGSAIAAAIAATTALAAPSVAQSARDRPSAVDGEFLIDSSVTSLPECTETALLYPGIERCLLYTVHNPLPNPITVTKISIAEVRALPGCDASSLDVSGSDFSGALDVPAGGDATTPPLRIALRETGVNQDACQGATFSLTFTGMAISEGGADVPGGGPHPPDDPPGGGFPRTGAAVWTLLVAAAGLLTVGAAAVGVAHRRNHGAPHELGAAPHEREAPQP